MFQVGRHWSGAELPILWCPWYARQRQTCRETFTVQPEALLAIETRNRGISSRRSCTRRLVQCEGVEPPLSGSTVRSWALSISYRLSTARFPNDVGGQFTSARRLCQRAMTPIII